MSKATIVWIIVAILFIALMIIVWSKNKSEQDELLEKKKPMAFQSVTGHVNVNPTLVTGGRG